MKKIISLSLAFFMLLTLVACGSQTGSDTLTGSYRIHVSGYDWGAGVDSVMVTLDHVVDAVDPEDFVIQETKQATDFASENKDIVIVNNEHTIKDVYLCDEKGEKTDQASKYIQSKLGVSPTEGSPLLYSAKTGFNTWSDPYELNIQLSEDADLTSNGKEVTSWTIDTAYTARVTSVDQFKKESFTATDGVTYQYASYEPQEGSDTLFVWLHGGDEGGVENTDPYVTLLGNKVSVYGSEAFQEAIGGANVLVPQCPTFWMDPKGNQIAGGNASAYSDGTSYYTKSLMELIEMYKEKTGSTKVILTGCSNGGFMALRLAIDYPDAFIAVAPVAEAMQERFLSDEDLNKIKDLPMYFVYSTNDPVADPTLHEIPTLARLQALGASNLHIATTDQVIDTSGTIETEDGMPYEYSGHWSWIYFHNNEATCNDCGLTPWQWMAEVLCS